MKEHPILFSDAMVRAILDRRKTQTWRLIRPDIVKKIYFFYRGAERDSVISFGDGHSGTGWYIHCDSCRDDGAEFLGACPYGTPGDHLWVMETWAWPGEEYVLYRERDQRIQDKFKTDKNYPQFDWRPSILMPRWASRITLEVTDVVVQRIQDGGIDECDDEGAETILKPYRRGEFEAPWDGINAKRAPRAKNYLTWAVSFRAIEIKTGASNE